MDRTSSDATESRLNDLIEALSNAAFECGAWNTDESVPYAHLQAAAHDAKKSLLAHLSALPAATGPSNDLYYRNALDRAAYALFQVKRMVNTPVHVIDFVREAHEEACKALNEAPPSEAREPEPTAWISEEGLEMLKDERGAPKAQVVHAPYAIYTVPLYAAPRSATATPQWISVKDRLPTDGDAVMCMAWCISADEHDSDGPCVMGYDDDEEEWHSRQDTGCWEPGAVTHWMPLPTEPK